ncbi:MAG: M20 family metallo-hydrolase [Bacteroidota bacterium]|jgi:acetylornithine deacetylase
MNLEKLNCDAEELLCGLISIPSFSRGEKDAADFFQAFLLRAKISSFHINNNVIAYPKEFDSSRPALLLNSHLDTVQPAAGWQFNPFEATTENGKIYGLGSNDAGASLCALTAAFCHYYTHENLPYNLILAATAEEEISGENGLTAILPQLGEIDCAIVGEPTQLQLAIAEKGLLVLDCVAKGVSGHAARNEGINAIDIAVDDLLRLRNLQFEKESPWLGSLKITPSIIHAGTQHNVVPGSCTFTLDVRVTENYTHEEIIAILSRELCSTINPRSMRLRSSFISPEHPLVKAGISLGSKCYGSPTLSDKALMPFPALKCGPGDSARSHTANEYIGVDELHNGIRFYIQLLENLFAHAHQPNRTTPLAENY